MTSVRFVVTGRVQGVGFRWFVRLRAQALGVGGWVRNRPDGAVEVVATGDDGALDALEASLREGPPAAAVSGVSRERTDHPSGSSGFEIR